MLLSLLGAQPAAGMDVRLLLRLLLLHVVTLLCAVNEDNVVEENLGEAQSVTSRPTTLQNITTPQCDNCPQTSTEHQPIHYPSVLCTNHTTQGPSPASSPIEYILYAELGVCFRLKAIFIIMLNNNTEITKVTIPSPPITRTSGWCYERALMTLYFPGGLIRLAFAEDEQERTFYLDFIAISIENKDGTKIMEYTYLQTMVTPIGQSYTCDVMTFGISPRASLVLMDVTARAFEPEDENLEGDESTFIIFDPWGRLRYSGKHWVVTRLVPSIYTVVFLVALPLNVMAIVMFLVKMKVRKPAVVYMLNLAAADVLLIIVLPFYIVYRFLGTRWLIGEGMCLVVTASFYCNMFCSVLLMTSISVDRFLAIVYPVRSLSWRSVKRAWLVCGAIWVISLASTAPLFMVEQTWISYRRDIITCHDSQHFGQHDMLSFNYFLSVFSLYNFLPLLITTFCYIGAIRSLSRSQFDRTHKRSRAIRLSVVVLCVFVLCFGPTNVLYLINFKQIMKAQRDYSLHIPYILSSCISSINCCLDPLIYYFASSECQSYVCSLLRCNKDHRPPIELEVIRVHRDQSSERTRSALLTESG